MLMYHQILLDGSNLNDGRMIKLMMTLHPPELTRQPKESFREISFPSFGDRPSLVFVFITPPELTFSKCYKSEGMVTFCSLNVYVFLWVR